MSNFDFATVNNESNTVVLRFDSQNQSRAQLSAIKDIKQVAPNVGHDLDKLPQINMEKALEEYRSGAKVETSVPNNKGTFSAARLADIAEVQKN